MSKSRVLEQRAKWRLLRRGRVRQLRVLKQGQPRVLEQRDKLS